MFAEHGYKVMSPRSIGWERSGDIVAAHCHFSPIQQLLEATLARRCAIMNGEHLRAACKMGLSRPPIVKQILDDFLPSSSKGTHAWTLRAEAISLLPPA